MKAKPLDADFDGRTYDAKRDRARLKGQLLAVYSVMKDGRWRSLQDLAEEVGAPATSVSARLRDLRKDKFGGFTVERVRATAGTHIYRLSHNLTA